MNRLKPATPQSAKPQPVPLPPLLNRVLVGAFAALVAARPLVSGDDPERLRLTSGSGPVSFTLWLFVILTGFAAWRVAFARGRPACWPVVPLLLAGVGIAAFASSRLSDRYARPGLFVAWEWIGLAVAFYLARRLTGSVSDSRGLLNVLLASAVSVGGLAVYQAVADRVGLAGTDVVVSAEGPTLAGDDEFYPQLNHPTGPVQQPRGTFDSPETLFFFLLLVLPVTLAVWRARRTSAWCKWAIALPLVLIAAAIAALLKSFAGEPNRWASAIELIAEHPALGVGPGNFSRFANDVPESRAAWFNLTATAGLIGLGLFLAAIAVAIKQSRPTSIPDPREPPVTGTRWEFYLGGVAGLLLGFSWAVGEMPAEAAPMEVFRLGATAILRAILWFAAFALFETIRPARAQLGRAILFGVAAVLLFGLASDAPGRPTVLFPLFVLLALGANFRMPEVPDLPDGPWTKPVRVVRAIAAAGLAIAHLVTAGVPAWSTADTVRQARMASRIYADRHRDIDRARPGPERATALTKARGFLLANIIIPLWDAVARDPGNASLWLELAHWRRPLWQYQLLADPTDAARVADETRKAAERAGHLDPHNRAAQRNLVEALLLYRANSETKPAERIAALNKLIAQIAERDPTAEVPLRFRVVQTMLDRKDSEEALKPEMTRLFELNREEGHGHMTDDQKDDAIEKAKKVMKDLPQVVLDEWTR